jgi:glutaredoxin-related protein
VADEISNTKDFLDIRDIIERFEELEGTYDTERNEEDSNQQESLRTLLEDLRGFGGDHEWRQDWYPVTLIHEDHFTDYCQKYYEECGLIARDCPAVIDWEETADQMKIDYAEVDFDGQTYYYR